MADTIFETTEDKHTIEYVSEVTGITKNTIRHWVKHIGIPVARAANQYRYFSDGDIVLLGMVKEGMDKGLGLPAIREIFIQRQLIPGDPLSFKHPLDSTSGSTSSLVQTNSFASPTNYENNQKNEMISYFEDFKSNFMQDITVMVREELTEKFELQQDKLIELVKNEDAALADKLLKALQEPQNENIKLKLDDMEENIAKRDEEVLQLLRELHENKPVKKGWLARLFNK